MLELSCQCNSRSLYLNAEEGPGCREREPQQAFSVCRQNRNRLSLHLPETSETSGLLTQVETLEKHVALTCRRGTLLHRKACVNFSLQPAPPRRAYLLTKVKFMTSIKYLYLIASSFVYFVYIIYISLFLMATGAC